MGRVTQLPAFTRRQGASRGRSLLRTPSLPAGGPAIIPARMQGTPSRPAELPRLLGAWSAASILIGSVIGSGVFVKPRMVAETLPSIGWILICWIAAGALSLIGSLAFAEMSSRYPNAGGQYAYLRGSFGRFPAFLFGWTNLTIINAASCAALACMAVEYLANIFRLDIEVSGWAAKSLAVGLTALLTAANAVGVLWGARIQNFLTGVKLLAIGAIIFGAVLPGRGSAANLSPFWTFRDEEMTFGKILNGFQVAFIAIFWAYDGWYLLSFSGGEIKNPRRNIPLGFTVGILVVAAVYVLANVAYFAAMPIGELAAVSKDRLGGVAAVVAERFYGPVGLTLISLGILGSMMGAANGNLLTGPRLCYAMARDRLFFRPFASVHSRFLTPAAAIGIQGVIAALCVFAGNFDDLTDSVVFAAWTFYGLTVAGLFILRRRHPSEPGGFRMPGFPLLPAFFVLFAGVFVVYNAYEAATKVQGVFVRYLETGVLDTTGLYPLFSTGVILLGVPFYLYFTWRSRGAPLVEATTETLTAEDAEDAEEAQRNGTGG